MGYVELTQSLGCSLGTEMNSFASGAAKHQSDSAYCCTLAGAHNSSSSSGTTEVAAHAMPAKMDAKRGISDA